MVAKKLQSAMEYLMTYGWAILIIAVVLGALYQLGIFGGNQSNLVSSCITNAGFLCDKPILNTSGVLAVVFGQISSGPLTITNVACTRNASTPLTTNSVSITAPSGSTTILQFYCPLVSDSLGSTFSGYLWIIYNTQTQNGILDRIGIVT
ncbi:MAG: hypothetical protein KGH69_05290, partial [Candidatus Micrarchaeota archaeon]|nr:hypothetical protein [Candidatus Micrarchaeota archaeon]